MLKRSQDDLGTKFVRKWRQVGLPKRSKIDPKGSQKRLFFIFVFDFDFGTILVPFWLPKGLPLGALSVPKSLPKNGPNLISQKERPNTLQDLPREPSRRPGKLPRASQEAPRTPPRRSTRLQKALKSPPGSPKWSRKRRTMISSGGDTNSSVR